VTERHLISREIGIDAAHRVTFHGSKCRNIHGHRYTVQAWCSGPLAAEGEQAGMVLDFGFLKDVMMREIDEPCDHGLILWVGDPFTPEFRPSVLTGVSELHCADAGFWAGQGNFGKLYLVSFVPTAENLARHWFGRMARPVRDRSGDRAELVGVKVWETPNCWAAYGPMFTDGRSPA
jgi:6-pyruvoyltetrahydropterin/6-carboxytetrahydropterin synthase